MKKLLLMLLVIITVSFDVNAQKSAKAIYGELGGPGLVSINYDMRFQNKEDGAGFRVGVGGYNIDGTSLFTLPVNKLFIRKRSKKLF